MTIERRCFLHLAAGTIAAPAFLRIARADTYPNRPVRVMIGYAPGGSADITARLTAQWLTEKLGQSFIVESRPGAGSNIGTEAALRSPPDGYTLLLVAPANAINASLYEKLPYNFLRDYTPVAPLIRFPNVMVVNPAVPAKTVAEFIAYAKANPHKINFASSGNGSTIHMSGELFKMMAGVDMVHVVYRGSAPAMTDLIAGQVQVMFDNLPTALPHIRAGSIRALAVTTTARAEVTPELPTLTDVLPGYESSAWYGLGGPKGIAADIVDKLNRTINTILAEPAAKARFGELGASLITGSPDDFGKLVIDETEKWAKVVKFAGVKAD